jgi:hypothetical protein
MSSRTGMRLGGGVFGRLGGRGTRGLGLMGIMLGSFLAKLGWVGVVEVNTQFV